MGYILWREIDGKIDAAGPLAKNIGEEKSELIRQRLNLNIGDSAFFLGGKPSNFEGFSARARNHIGSELKLIDENIFAYTEDCDLSYRLTKIGYNLIIMPNITAHHINSGSTQTSVKQHWRKDWNFAWSTLYLLKKHRGSKRARNEGISLLLRRAPKALFYLFTFNVKRFTRDGTIKRCNQIL